MEMKLEWVIAAAVAMFLIVLGTSGCATAPVTVTRSCIIPNELDYVAEGPAPLEVKDTPAADHLTDEAKDRHAHHLLAMDYNKLHDHVKKDCN